MSDFTITRNSTLPNTSDKSDFHNLVDTATVTISSVPDTDLQQIATAGKVSGAALTTLNNIPSGAGAIPNANLGNATIAPATNTANSVPQWNGANSKTLKDGLVVGTSANNLVQLDSSAKLPAVDGSQLTNVSGAVETSWTDYGDTSTVTGFASFIQKNIYTEKIGSIAFVTFAIAGTSNADSLTFTLPYTSANTTVGFGGALRDATDNGSPITTACKFQLPANSATVSCYKNMVDGAWTTSGTKIVAGSFFYRVA